MTNIETLYKSRMKMTVIDCIRNNYSFSLILSMFSSKDSPAKEPVLFDQISLTSIISVA